MLEQSPIDLHGPYTKAFRNSPNRGPRLYSLWNADGIAIVLNYKQHRQRLSCRPIQRLEEFALARGAFTGFDVHYSVRTIGLHRLGGTDSRKILRTGTRGLRYEVQLS